MLLAAVTGYLEEAFAINRAARETGKWDGLSFSRSAIEPHEQDRDPDDWEFVVDVARDVLEWLLEHEPSLGFSVIDLWEGSESQVLQRLAIHGWGRRKDMPPEAVLQHIVEQGWLYGQGLKHEVFMLLKAPVQPEEPLVLGNFDDFRPGPRALPGTLPFPAVSVLRAGATRQSYLVNRITGEPTTVWRVVGCNANSISENAASSSLVRRSRRRVGLTSDWLSDIRRACERGSPDVSS